MSKKQQSKIPDTLYYYCSNRVFLSIIENKKIWLSSLMQSNDSLEGKIILNTIKILFNDKILAENLQPAEKERMVDAFNIFCKFFSGNIEKVMCLGICFSEKRDLLSQWRGYADDGSGVCIGFPMSLFEDYFVSSSIDVKKRYSLVKIKYEKSIAETVATIILNDFFKKMRKLQIIAGFKVHKELQ